MQVPPTSFDKMTIQEKCSFDLDFVQNRSNPPPPQRFLDLFWIFGTLFQKSKLWEISNHPPPVSAHVVLFDPVVNEQESIVIRLKETTFSK